MKKSRALTGVDSSIDVLPAPAEFRSRPLFSFTGNDYGAAVATARIHLLSVAIGRLGPLEVAKRLDIPAGVLQDWIDGKSAIPPTKVLALIDLLDSLDAF